MSSTTDQFISYYPEFATTDANRLLMYDTMISRAANMISLSSYGQFYLEAIYAKTAALIYLGDLSIRNQNGRELGRNVANEYSVTYADSYDFNGNLLNPYDKILEQIGIQAGINYSILL